jgi:hypothetical protein
MRTNPIAQRLQRLSDQWAQFAGDPKARVMCWQLTAAELPMFDAFIEQESDEQSAEHADVFVTFDTPFVRADEYGAALSRSLADGYSQGADELRALGLAADWQLPAADKSEQDIAYLLRTCQTFVAFYQIQSLLVLVLRPREVSDSAAYTAWLQRFALEAPAFVRVLLLDAAEHPAHAQLSAAAPEKLRSVAAALDLARALEQLSDEAGGLDTPGGQFRGLFVRLGNALSQADLSRALALGSQAVELARAHALWHLAVPVQVALGAALAGEGRAQEALAQYVAAETDAQCGMAQADATASAICKTLYLQSRLAHGAALIGFGSMREAATSFEESAALAAADGAHVNELDAHRLASFCHEQAGASERAWQSALAGLAVAHQITPSERENTSLPYLGAALLRLVVGRSDHSATRLDRELAQLLGKETWQPPQPTAAAVNA